MVARHSVTIRSAAPLQLFWLRLLLEALGCCGARLAYSSFEEPCLRGEGIKSTSFEEDSTCTRSDPCRLTDQPPGFNARGYRACQNGRAEIGFHSEWFGTTPARDVQVGVTSQPVGSLANAKGWQVFSLDGEGGTARVQFDSVDLSASQGSSRTISASCMVKADFSRTRQEGWGGPSGTWAVPATPSPTVNENHRIGFTSFEEPEVNMTSYQACSHNNVKDSFELGFEPVVASSEGSQVIRNSSNSSGTSAHGQQYYRLRGSEVFTYVQIDPVSVADYSEVQMRAWARVTYMDICTHQEQLECATGPAHTDRLKIWVEDAVLGVETVLVDADRLHNDPRVIASQWVQYSARLNGMSEVTMKFGIAGEFVQVDFDGFEITGSGPDRTEAMCNRDICGLAIEHYTVGAETVECQGERMSLFEAWLIGDSDGAQRVPLVAAGFQQGWTRLAAAVPGNYSAARLVLEATLGAHPWLIDACEFDNGDGDSESFSLDCNDTAPVEPARYWAEISDGSLPSKPSARKHTLVWVSEDESGTARSILFGGCEASTQCRAGTGVRNDMWFLNSNTLQWSFAGGSQADESAGLYGEYPSFNEYVLSNNWGECRDPAGNRIYSAGDAIACSTNSAENAWVVFWPGARYRAVSWQMPSGEMFILGGYGFDGGPSIRLGYLNDLWMLSHDGSWTWLSGHFQYNANGRYGSVGVPGLLRKGWKMDNSVDPGSRAGAVAWTDESGDAWIFGGDGFDGSSAGVGKLNDLFRFHYGSTPETSRWTWMAGSNENNALGDYSSISTCPGARSQMVGWADGAGGGFVFGGEGLEDNLLNDLWHWDSAAWELERNPATKPASLEGGAVLVQAPHAVLADVCGGDTARLGDQVECEEAAADLGLVAITAHNVNNANYPAGCLLDTTFGRQELFYNLAIEGSASTELLAASKDSVDATISCDSLVERSATIGGNFVLFFAVASGNQPIISFSVCDGPPVAFDVEIIAIDGPVVAREQANASGACGAAVPVVAEFQPSSKANGYEVNVSWPLQSTGTFKVSMNCHRGNTVMMTSALAKASTKSLCKCETQHCTVDGSSMRGWPAARVDAAALLLPTVGRPWLISGEGIDEQNQRVKFMDRWEYSPSSQSWTLLGGSAVRGGDDADYDSAMYGWQQPNPRAGAVAWVDGAGRAMLFGGTTPTTSDSVDETWVAEMQCPAGFARGSAPGSCHQCPSGQYSAAPGSEDCVQCHLGTWSEHAAGSTRCVDRCPPRQYRADSGACTTCASGEISVLDGSVCVLSTDCPAGQYFGEHGDTCRACPAGKFALRGSVECSLCPPGKYAALPLTESCSDCEVAKYAVAGSLECKSCIAGSSIAGVGMSISDCIACPAGQTDHDSDPSSGCVACERGRYAGTASLAPSQPVLPADLLTLVNRQSSFGDCTACPKGTHQDPDDPRTYDSCAACRIGRFDADSSSITPCETCANGTFATVEWAFFGCTTCIAGKEWLSAADACIDCTEGQTDHDNDPTTPCVQCAAGTFIDHSTHTGDCATCDHGTQFNFSAAVRTSDACVACEPGRTDNDTDSLTPCVACKTGRFIDVDGHHGSCTSCPPGTFFDVEVAVRTIDACDPCRPGKIDSDSDSLTECVDCEAGKYQDHSTQTSCESCTAGRAFNFSAAVRTFDACVACEPGRTDNDTDSLTPCVACKTGRFIDADGHNGSCTSCRPGTFFDVEVAVRTMDACGPCRPGKIDSDSDSLTECVDCEAGKYQDDFAQTSCESCTAGTVFDFDASRRTMDACVACGAGNTDDDSDSLTPCVECGYGRYNDDDTKGGECMACPAGKNFMDKRCIPMQSDCTTGYVPGNVGQPSTSCPEHCRFVAAVELVQATVAACAGADDCTLDEDEATCTGNALCTYVPATNAVFSNESCTVPDCALDEASLYLNRSSEITCAENCAVEILVRKFADVCISCAGRSHRPDPWGAPMNSDPCQMCEAGKEPQDDGTRCGNCQPGMQVYEVQNEQQCNDCPVGKVDHDNLTETPCLTCPAGRYEDSVKHYLLENEYFAYMSGGTICQACEPGRQGAVEGAGSNTEVDPSDTNRYPVELGGEGVRSWNRGQTGDSLSDICQKCRGFAAERPWDAVCAAGDDTIAQLARTTCTWRTRRSTYYICVTDGARSCQKQRAECVQHCVEQPSGNEITRTQGTSGDYFCNDFDSDGQLNSMSGCGNEKWNWNTILFKMQCGVACPVGSYDSDADGATSCLDCEPGKFQDEEAQLTCKDCSSGKYQLAVRAADGSSCTACEAGTYDNDNSPDTRCQRCERGKYGQGGGSECIECNPGTFSEFRGATSQEACKDCPAGRFATRGRNHTLQTSTGFAMGPSTLSLDTELAEATEVSLAYTFVDPTEVSEYSLNTFSAGCPTSWRLEGRVEQRTHFEHCLTGDSESCLTAPPSTAATLVDNVLELNVQCTEIFPNSRTFVMYSAQNAHQRFGTLPTQHENFVCVHLQCENKTKPVYRHCRWLVQSHATRERLDGSGDLIPPLGQDWRCSSSAAMTGRNWECASSDVQLPSTSMEYVRGAVSQRGELFHDATAGCARQNLSSSVAELWDFEDSDVLVSEWNETTLAMHLLPEGNLTETLTLPPGRSSDVTISGTALYQKTQVVRTGFSTGNLAVETISPTIFRIVSTDWVEIDSRSNQSCTDILTADHDGVAATLPRHKIAKPSAYTSYRFTLSNHTANVSNRSATPSTDPQPLQLRDIQLFSGATPGFRTDVYAWNDVFRAGPHKWAQGTRTPGFRYRRWANYSFRTEPDPLRHMLNSDAYMLNRFSTERIRDDNFTAERSRCADITRQQTCTGSCIWDKVSCVDVGGSGVELLGQFRAAKTGYHVFHVESESDSALWLGPSEADALRAGAIVRKSTWLQRLWHDETSREYSSQFTGGHRETVPGRGSRLSLPLGLSPSDPQDLEQYCHVFRVFNTIHFPAGADTAPWLQIDLGSPKLIGGVTTQRCHDGSSRGHVANFTVSYGLEAPIDQSCTDFGSDEDCPQNQCIWYPGALAGSAGECVSPCSARDQVDDCTGRCKWANNSEEAGLRAQSYMGPPGGCEDRLCSARNTATVCDGQCVWREAITVVGTMASNLTLANDTTNESIVGLQITVEATAPVNSSSNASSFSNMIITGTITSYNSSTKQISVNWHTHPPATAVGISYVLNATVDGTSYVLNWNSVCEEGDEIAVSMRAFQTVPGTFASSERDGFTDAIFPSPVLARYVRINLLEWTHPMNADGQSRLTLRADVLGMSGEAKNSSQPMLLEAGRNYFIKAVAAGNHVSVGVTEPNSTVKLTPIPVQGYLFTESLGLNGPFPFDAAEDPWDSELLQSGSVHDDLWNGWVPTVTWTESNGMPGSLIMSQYPSGGPLRAWRHGDAQAPRFLSAGIDEPINYTEVHVSQTFTALDPAHSLFLVEHFAVRWRGGLHVTGTGRYSLQMITGGHSLQDEGLCFEGDSASILSLYCPTEGTRTGNNGARVYIDESVLLESNGAATASQSKISANLTLTAGVHGITIVFFQASGVARFELHWQHVKEWYGEVQWEHPGLQSPSTGWVPLSTNALIDGQFDTSTSVEDPRYALYLHTGDTSQLIALEGTSACRDCPAGQFADATGQYECQDCDPGKFSSRVGAQTAFVCAECEPGQFDNDRNPATPCLACFPGHHQELSGQTNCSECNIGTYQPERGATAATSCTECEAGQFDGDFDPSSACLDCVPMTYSGETGQTTCTCCNAGTFQPLYGAGSPDACENCAAGKFDHDGSPLTACAGCEPGKYREDGDPQECRVCTEGTYQPHYNATSEFNCISCPAGQYDHDGLELNTWESTLTPCQDCPAGMYQDQPGQLGCISCIHGKQQLETGASEERMCEDCELGTADEDLAAATSCTECRPGYYQNTPSQIECIQCYVGKEQLHTKAISEAECFDCPAGHIDGDEDGATACSACAPGRFRPERITGVITYEYPDGATPSFLDITEIGGLEQVKPRTFCYDCPYGSEQLETGQTVLEDCISCPAGYSDLDRNASTACLQCVAGFYAPAPPPSALYSSGRHGDMGSPTGCTRCPGSEEVPLYSKLDRQSCVQACPQGQYGKRIDGSLSDLHALQLGSSPSTNELSDNDFGSWTESGSWSESGSWGEDNLWAPDDGALGQSNGRRAQESETESGPEPEQLTVFTCMACAAGTESKLEGQLETSIPFPCQGCPIGRSDHDSFAGSECRTCQPGKYTNELAQTSCRNCPAGQYSSPDADTCLSAESCPPGSYIDEPNSACSACTMGQYNEWSGQDNCFNCQPTTANNNTGSSSKTDCRVCDDGTATIIPGSAYCVDCDVGQFGQAGECWECDVRMRCDAYGLAYPDAQPGYWISHYENWDQVFPNDGGEPQLSLARVERCPGGVCPSLAECAPPQGCEHGGLHNCTTGYYKDRCSACTQGYFRLNGLCELCPADAIPPWVYVIAAFGFLLGAAVSAEWIWSNTFLRHIGAREMGMLMAPVMVMITFCQTCAIVLDVPRIKFPPELRAWLSNLNFINFNFELASPECSIKWDFAAKLNTTILMPFFVIALVQTYKQIAMRVMLRSKASLRQQLLTVHCSLFSLGTVNYLKTILAAWDCSINSDNLYYLDAQPSIECNLNNAEYRAVLRMSLFGLSVYLVTLSVVLKGIFGIRLQTSLTECRDERAGKRTRKKGERVRLKTAKRCLGGLLVLDMEKGRQQFAFFASKVRADWYWWELVVLARKAALVMIAMFNSRSVERGWFMMSNLQVFAIVAHLTVQPYRQRLTNMYEFFCLFSAFIVFQSSMAFTFEDLDPTRQMATWLLFLNQFIIASACMACFGTEFVACREVYGGLLASLEKANQDLAVQILDSSEHIAELQVARDEAETEYLMHTITDEALRLAHGGKQAKRIRKKHLATLPRNHDQLKANIDQYVYFKSWKSGQLKVTTADKLPQLLQDGDVTHHTLAWTIGMPPCEEHFGVVDSMERHMQEMCPRLAIGDEDDKAAADIPGQMDDTDTGPASANDSAEDLLLKLSNVYGGCHSLKAAVDDARSAQIHAQKMADHALSAKEKERAAAMVSKTAAEVERAEEDLAAFDRREDQELVAKQLCADMINAKAKANATTEHADGFIVYDENGRRVKRAYDRLSLALQERQLLIDEEAECTQTGNLDRLLQLEGLLDACNKYIFLLGGDIDVVDPDEYDSEHDDEGMLRGDSTSRSSGHQGAEREFDSNGKEAEWASEEYNNPLGIDDGSPEVENTDDAGVPRDDSPPVSEESIERPDNSVLLRLEAELQDMMEAGGDETSSIYVATTQALEKEKMAFDAAMVDYKRAKRDKKKRAAKNEEARRLRAEADALARRQMDIAQKIQHAGRKWVHKPMVSLVDQPIRRKHSRGAKGIMHKAWLHPGDIFTVLSVNVVGAKRHRKGEDIELRTQLEIITAARVAGYIYPEDEDGKALIEFHDSTHFSKRNLMDENV